MHKAKSGVAVVAAMLALAVGLANGQNEKQSEVRESAAPVMSLQDAIEAATAKFPGRVIEAELEDEHGEVRYEVEIVGEDGLVREIEVHAKTGQVTVEETEHLHGGEHEDHDD